MLGLLSGSIIFACLTLRLLIKNLGTFPNSSIPFAIRPNFHSNILPVPSPLQNYTLEVEDEEEAFNISHDTDFEEQISHAHKRSQTQLSHHHSKC